MNDYRDESTRDFHAAMGVAQEMIDLWNEGYWFQQTYFPDGVKGTPVRKAMEYARFTIIDFSPEAEMYWGGYEQAVRDQEARGMLFKEDLTGDDMVFALEQIVKFITEKGKGKDK